MKSVITPDQAKARAVLCAMTSLVDLQEWDQLSRCFADRVTVDYSSLWGGEAQEISRDDLIGQWKAMLPGFDATCHELDDIEVSVIANEANGSAKVRGTHLLNGQAWVVAGRYRCTLRRGPRWMIGGLAYLNESESGDRKLTDHAKERASAANRS